MGLGRRLRRLCGNSDACKPLACGHTYLLISALKEFLFAQCEGFCQGEKCHHAGSCLVSRAWCLSSHPDSATNRQGARDKGLHLSQTWFPLGLSWEILQQSSQQGLAHGRNLVHTPSSGPHGYKSILWSLLSSRVSLILPS